MDTPHPRLLTSAELADRWQIPVKTLDNWAWRGKGPRYLRIGRHRRYDIASVEVYEATQVRGGNHVPA